MDEYVEEAFFFFFSLLGGEGGGDPFVPPRKKFGKNADLQTPQIFAFWNRAPSSSPSLLLFIFIYPFPPLTFSPPNQKMDRSRF